LLLVCYCWEKRMVVRECGDDDVVVVVATCCHLGFCTTAVS